MEAGGDLCLDVGDARAQLKPRLLDARPRLGVRAHAASAARWRVELRVGVRFVLDELRAAAAREPAGGCGEGPLATRCSNRRSVC